MRAYPEKFLERLTAAPQLQRHWLRDHIQASPDLNHLILNARD